MSSSALPPPQRDNSAYNLAVIITLLLLLLALFLIPRGEHCCGDDLGKPHGTEHAAGKTMKQKHSPAVTHAPTDASALEDQMAAWPGCEAVLAASYVSFESGSGRLTEKGARLLDRLIVCLEDGNYLIVGHTDNQGNEASNLILSQQRAESVRAYLIGKGMDPARLTTQGAGESDPIASNDSEAGRARNRRIEFIRQQ